MYSGFKKGYKSPLKTHSFTALRSCLEHHYCPSVSPSGISSQLHLQTSPVDVSHPTDEARRCHPCVTSPTPLQRFPCKQRDAHLLELGKMCFLSGAVGTKLPFLTLFLHIGSVCKQSKSTVTQVFCFVLFFNLLSSQTPTPLQRSMFDLKHKLKPVKVMFERMATEGLGGLIWIQGCSAETEQFKPFVLVWFVVSLSLFRF